MLALGQLEGDSQLGYLACGIGEPPLGGGLRLICICPQKLQTRLHVTEDKIKHSFLVSASAVDPCSLAVDLTL